MVAGDDVISVSLSSPSKNKQVLVKTERRKCVFIAHVKITFVITTFQGSFEYHLCPVKNFRIFE